jgi:hypothetical protein
MSGDAFTFKTVGYDYVKKEYTLQNIKTGELKIICKEDFYYYIEQNRKERRKPHRGKNNNRRVI